MLVATLEATIHAVLRSGLDARLFSAAAVGVRCESDRVIATVGTPAFGESGAITASSLFDLASLTKTYVAAATVALADRGTMDLDSPVADILPIGVGPGADRITLRMLLRHTSGLPAISEIWRDAEVAPGHRMRDLLRSRLEAAPDTRFTYSCPGYVAVGAVIEAATAAPLSQVLQAEVLTPLGAKRTAFGPVPRSMAVATEYEHHVGRGLVRGEVHDELSWYLGGRTGNAGLFAPVEEVLKFAESFLAPGLLSGRALQEMTSPSLRPSHGAAFDHGLGVRIGDAASIGSARGFGHTGFTGTMWIADPDAGWAAVLLTNRVHPDRTRVKLASFRREFMNSIEPFL
ncbi:serine hydrolase domain-containing protein [Microbacterium sp. C23T]